MSSLISAVGEGEHILPEMPEMGELSEFHPDQLSNLVDIQEELDKLVAHERQNEDMEMLTVEDVGVVDHEVTIGEDQEEDCEMTILPDIPNIEDVHAEEIDNMLEESLDIAQTITIEAPTVMNELRPNDQLHNQHVIMEEKKTLSTKPATSIPSANVSHLKAIRPLPEGLKGKRTSINLATIKKNVLTKVIFTPNSQGNLGTDTSFLFGDSGGQAIKIIGQNKTLINSPKPITLAQAREMGLLSPGKIQQILPNQSKGIIKQGVMMKSSPTKILPLPPSGQLLPITPSPALNTLTTNNIVGGTHKIIFRHSPTIKTGTFTNTILTTTTSGSQGQLLQIPISQDNLGNQIHQIQLPGKQVQYVRLMPSTPSTNVSLSAVGVENKPDLSPIPNIAPSPPTAPVPIALITNNSSEPATTNDPAKTVHSAPTPTTVPQTTNSFERVLVSPGLSQLASGLDAKSTANNIVMVPAEYLKHYKPPPPPPPVKPVSVPAPPSPPPQLKPLPASATAPLLTKAKDNTTSKETVNPQPTHKGKISVEPPNGLRPRKPCNCTKSQCLKLYCDCFANGEFCFQCNCNCCFNNLDHEEDRQRAIKACLERNPNAFRPKIGKGYIGDERRHNKGCNCKRSGCLKNYCECYEAKIPCSKNCKCVGCRNVEDKDSKDRGPADGSKVSQQAAVKNKLSTEIQESAYRSYGFLTNQGIRQPFNLMTQEVVEATCQCLLAQVEGEAQLNEHVQRLILEEFGRCLVQIIDCAARTTVNNST